MKTTSDDSRLAIEVCCNCKYCIRNYEHPNISLCMRYPDDKFNCYGYCGDFGLNIKLMENLTKPKSL